MDWPAAQDTAEEVDEDTELAVVDDTVVVLWAMAREASAERMRKVERILIRMVFDDLEWVWFNEISLPRLL